MKGKGDNMNKEFAVFGLGKFGVSVAKSLMTLGCQVIVVDRNEERVQEIADDVTYAMVADVTDSQVLENLGIRNLDGVVIAISNEYGSQCYGNDSCKGNGCAYGSGQSVQ